MKASGRLASPAVLTVGESARPGKALANALRQWLGESIHYLHLDGHGGSENRRLLIGAGKNIAIYPNSTKTVRRLAKRILVI